MVSEIDIHLHDEGQAGIGEILDIADRTEALGMNGKVTVSHAFCLGSVDRDRAKRVAERLAAAGVSIVTSGPGVAPMPPINILRKAGVHVAAGSDNIRDLWSPFGNASMIERCWLIAWRSGYRTDEDIAGVLDLATNEAALMLDLPDYGLKPGAYADLIAVSGDHVPQIIVERPKPDLVLRRGRIAHVAAALAPIACAKIALPAVREFST